MEEKPIWIWAAGAALIALVAFSAMRPRGEPSGSTTPSGQSQSQSAAGPNPSGGAINVSIANASAKQEWLHQAVAAFNDASRREREWQAAGRPVSVQVLQEEIDGKKVDYRSGTMVSDTIAGKIKPTVLSPGEESWIGQLRRQWRGLHGADIAREDAPVVARTPQVLAMWQSRARALGCWPAPDAGCTWERIRGLATHPGGWELLGRPEWRQLKIGYSYFGESNSGTLGVVAMCMVGAGKSQGLVMEDIDPSTGCGTFIRDIEVAKAHSGKKSDWLLERLVQGGPEYLDAVVTWETEVIQLNQKLAGAMREPLVAVYPQDGTVVVGHPYAILDGAPWVTSEQVEAAKVFRAYLLRREQQERLVASGLRPADASVRLASPIAPAHGASPDAKLVPLEVPDPLLIERIGEVWQEVRKHAIVALVFDKSGSMQTGAKIRAASRGAQEFVGQMHREDQLLWLPFDDKLHAGAQGRKAEVGERLVGDIAGIGASGGTALYDAVLAAHERLSALRQAHGGAYRYGMVVLSDGRDENSKWTLTMLESALRPQEGDPTGIQIHTIAIGSDADEGVLKRVASAAHGRYWKGQSEKDMIAIYGEIAKHY